MFKTKEIVKQFLEKHYSKDYYFTNEGECSKCDIFDTSFLDDSDEQKDGGVFEFQDNLDDCIQFIYKNRTIKISPFLCDKSDNFVYNANISTFTMVIKQKDELIIGNDEWNINNYDFYFIPNKILQTWFNEYKKSHGKKDLISCWFRLKSLINNQKYKNNFDPLDKYIASIDKQKINTEIEEKINQQIKRGI